MRNIYRLKLAILGLFVFTVTVFFLFDHPADRRVHAFSSGPPAGYTRAPGEEPEACAECHVVTDPGAGTINLTVPQTYSPGQIYNITVTHANSDPSRIRWGFQLTALDPSEEKAGTLQPLDNLTQVLNNQGPIPARQYIEHTSTGTFFGQQNGASWTFRWTAPSMDVGPVTFYVAGNHANGDSNSSGDQIYFTFAAATFSPPTPDFTVSVTPSSRTVVPGGPATYDVTVTPAAGFTGTVNLDAMGLPSGASAGFSPPSISIANSNAQTSVLTLTTSAVTPLGSFPITVRGTSGMLQRTAQTSLVVASPASADLSLSISDSPDPVIVATNLAYRIEVTNNGPAAANGVMVTDNLPVGVTFVSAVPSQGSCSGTTSIFCNFGDVANGAIANVTITVLPQTVGALANTASVSATQSDPIPANNSATATTAVVGPSTGPRMLVSNLGVRSVVSGLNQPTSMAFIGPNDFLILEKDSGRVLRVTNGIVAGTVLDLAVNSASERGLLGITLHPNFASNGFVYLYWTESLTGADTTAIESVALLGNRVDRYVWNGSTLAFNQNVIQLRAFQADAGQPQRGNHDGGVLTFGPDNKLYVVVGDLGRRGLLQNITSGGPVPDDQFGGPEPDNAHMSGVILRLDDDGSIPTDNPFFNVSTGFSGEAATNVRKIFAYGVRNSFGMDFDPVGGYLWTQENGDDAFDEINRIEGGFNGGWVQFMGPSSRLGQFKQIETNRAGGLQQIRWPPSNLADTPAQALSRLFTIPGSTYTEPAFSWKYAVAPSPIGFARGNGLGAQYANDLFVGASRTTLLGGYLFRFNLSGDRKTIAFDDPRLADLVADNEDKFDLAESESLLVGRDFGITTDIHTGPNGNLYVVSLSNGAIYEIFSQPTLFVASLDGMQEIPPNNSTAKGTAAILLNTEETSARVSLTFSGLSTPQTVAHIHGPATATGSAPPIFDLPLGNSTDFVIPLTPEQVQDLKSGLFYVNVHSNMFPAGEIRGQFGAPASAPAAVFLNVSINNVGEGANAKSISVTRMGDTSVPVTVDYTTTDGSANDRKDYTTARGTLRFAAGETSKSFDVLITDDAFVETSETFNVTLSNPVGAVLVTAATSTAITITDNDSPGAPNPIDQTGFFVRQHYHDFLNREPEPAGLQFWSDVIESCGLDAQCREVRRINVSAAFFLSIEFQETGYVAYRFYEASFDRQPRYLEFIQDSQEIGREVIVGVGSWQQQLETNKQMFADQWVQRANFKAVYDVLSNSQYVDRLFQNAGVTPSQSERDNLVNGLDAGSETRATVLRKAVDNEQFKSNEFSRAFVLMEYFGYLRRNPDDPPDSNFDGYNFWLNKLNQFNGDFIRAEMVKAFILSLEYRQRFGQ